MDVALVTCRELPDLDHDDQPLLAALAALGVEASPVVWDDPAFDWSRPRLCVVRSTWDYPARRDEFIAWAARASAATTVLNPPDVLRWNTHKGYLIEFEERGMPVVPTAWLGAGDRIDLAALLAARGWSDAVVKPAVSAGSRGTVRVPSGDPMAQRHLDELVAHADVMVQPYLRRVESEGELSLVYLEGRFSHAVRKLPRVGEFRVQTSFGGTYAEIEAPPGSVDLGTWVLEATGGPHLYSRVDLVPADDGMLQLAEVELTEPSLYLTVADGAAERFADAIFARFEALG